jgi:hypothetical protein
MKEQSFWIEDQQIVDAGVIVGPPDLARAAAELKPVYA